MRDCILKKVLLFSFVFFLALGCGQEVRSIEVDPTTIDFRRAAQSEQLSAKALDIRGLEVPKVPLSYRSENPTVAEVDSSGRVRPVGNGSAAIVVTSPGGTEGESFIKVCLPKSIECDPKVLELKVGSAAPLKCHALDCGDEKLSGILELTPSNEKMLLKEGNDTFIGLAKGDAAVEVEGFGLKISIPVKIEEQTFAPGMEPGSKRPHRGGGAARERDDKPKGRYDHILKNMKF